MNLQDMQRIIAACGIAIKCCDRPKNRSHSGTWIPIDIDSKLYTGEYRRGYSVRRGVYCLECGNYLGQEFKR